MTAATLPQSISEAHQGFESKRWTVTSLTSAYLDRAKANRLNAWITICEERALKQAQECDAILAREGKVPSDRLPLFGVPLGVKDLLTVAGERTTCASKLLANYVPPYTATAVERLERAGAVTIGKLNLDEFAMGGSNENSAFGPVEHPTHPGRVPGGSSGGSAAAVRAGECLVALGSDTGGSIRLPASFCGIFGLKPTYGRVSRSGLVAFASSLDQAGPMTLAAEDAAIVMAAMAGHDPLDSTSAPQPTGDWRKVVKATTWKGVRVGVPEALIRQGLSHDVEKVFRGAIERLRTAGAEIVPVELPHASHAIATYYVVAVSEASANLQRFDGVRYGVRPKAADQASDLPQYYAEARAEFGAEVKRRILLGTFALSSGYADAYYRRACQVRRLIQQDFLKAFAGVDVIACPVAPAVAFRRGEKADPLQMYLNDIFTVPANLAGLPAVSVPAGDDAEGLSIGLQLTGPAFSDERLLGLSHAFEQARGEA